MGLLAGGEKWPKGGRTKVGGGGGGGVVRVEMHNIYHLPLIMKYILHQPTNGLFCTKVSLIIGSATKPDAMHKTCKDFWLTQ